MAPSPQKEEGRRQRDFGLAEGEPSQGGPPEPWETRFPSRAPRLPSAREGAGRRLAPCTAAAVWETTNPMREHRAPGKPAGPSGNGKGSGESLGRGKPMGARACTAAMRSGWNSGTERVLEVGECGGFGHRGPTTRRKDSWRQENHCLGEELRRVGRLGGGSGAGDSRRSARNQANPMTGSRVQQTCKPCAE